MSDLISIRWYATVLRHEMFAGEVAKVAPLALRYGATQFRVHIDNDDRYKITQMTWVPEHSAWYRYWEGPEMIEFRARFLGKYQIPINYSWADEIAAGEMGLQDIDGYHHVDPDPEPKPSMTASDGF